MTKISPAHYQQGSIDVWDYIIDQNLNYLEGCIIKYISRAGAKEGETRLDDLLKAQAYIHKAVLTEIDAIQSTGPTGSSDPVQKSDEPADRYHEWYCSNDATQFDR